VTGRSKAERLQTAIDVKGRNVAITATVTA
jgi:hypothetical protein